MIVLVSFHADLHAHVIRHELKKLGHSVALVEVDEYSQKAEAAWQLGGGSWVPDSEGVRVDLTTAKVVWWRRSRPPLGTSTRGDLVIRTDTAMLLGALKSRFAGTWVSAPEATVAAGNKLLQLAVASGLGFRVPKTLVSNSPAEVNKFRDEVGDVIAKPVDTPASQFVYTQTIRKDVVVPNETIMSCAAIYQEFVPGLRHLRVNVFGSSVYAFEIVSSDTDWRPALAAAKVSPVQLSGELGERLTQLLVRLRLSMGIFDLKYDDATGEIVWFEVNPQGQFLFLEGITRFPLGNVFAKYLIECANSA